MSKEMDENMSRQIGDMGGDPSNAEQKPAGLGKIKMPGKKQDLTKDEEEAKNKFLERQAAMRERNNSRSSRIINGEMVEDLPITEGWVPFDRDELGERSKFYPETWEFYIRPATVEAIKNWMAIDEENLLQLNHTFSEIVKFCVKIKNGSDTVSWGNINSWDRFWIISKVRELSMASNKKTITFEDSCPECDGEITFELRPENLHYEFPDEDLVEKYWTGSNWVIDPQEYDLDHPIITLYTPTLAKEEAVIEWARREHERGKKLDEIFPRFALWMISKPSRDADMFDKQMKKAYTEYKSWDIDFYKFMDEVIRNITINPKETLKQKCPHCGEEVISTVKFPNGIKALFDVETRGKKFGTK